MKNVMSKIPPKQTLTEAIKVEILRMNFIIEDEDAGSCTNYPQGGTLTEAIKVDKLYMTCR